MSCSEPSYRLQWALCETVAPHLELSKYRILSATDSTFDGRTDYRWTITQTKLKPNPLLQNRRSGSKRLVFVGGGHAHLAVLSCLKHYVDRSHEVKVIEPSPYLYYSGMGPGMLSGIYRPDEVHFHIKKMTEDRGGTFVEDKVTRIDPSRRLLFLGSGHTIGYDVVSFNTGSDVPMGPYARQDENVFTVKPIENLLKARKLILQRMAEGTLRLVVLGGGPAGVEIASNLRSLIRESGGTAKITLVAGTNVLSALPEKARSLAMDSLSRRGIEAIEGAHATSLERGRVTLEGGRTLPSDLAIVATGVRPSSLFLTSGLPTERDGGLLVNVYLQCLHYPEIFGGGDCISFADRFLAKIGVYAVRQNPVLYHNLMATLEGPPLRPFHPGRSYLQILNMGDGKGILWKNGLIWNGRLAFMLKDFIDRRFMKKFQVSGELDDI